MSTRKWNMAIALSNTNLPARTTRYGADVFTMAAGKSLVIETTPSGDEILSAEVSEGKTWAVTVTVSIVETDA